MTEKDPECANSSPHGRPFPVALDPFQATRYEIAAFGRDAFAENIRYLGGLLSGGNRAKGERSAAASAGLALNPGFSVFRARAWALSDNPTYSLGASA